MNDFQFTTSMGENQSQLIWEGGTEWIQVGLPVSPEASYQITVHFGQLNAQKQLCQDT